MTIWFGLHLWCGIGGNLGLFPELRLGFVRFGCCKGAVAEHVRAARSRMEATLATLLKRKGRGQ